MSRSRWDFRPYSISNLGFAASGGWAGSGMRGDGPKSSRSSPGPRCNTTPVLCVPLINSQGHVLSLAHPGPRPRLQAQAEHHALAHTQLAPLLAAFGVRGSSKPSTTWGIRTFVTMTPACRVVICRRQGSICGNNPRPSRPAGQTRLRLLMKLRHRGRYVCLPWPDESYYAARLRSPGVNFHIGPVNPHWTGGYGCFQHVASHRDQIRQRGGRISFYFWPDLATRPLAFLVSQGKRNDPKLAAVFEGSLDSPRMLKRTY